MRRALLRTEERTKNKFIKTHPRHYLNWKQASVRTRKPSFELERLKKQLPVEDTLLTYFSTHRVCVDNIPEMERPNMTL